MKIIIIGKAKKGSNKKSFATIVEDFMTGKKESRKSVSLEKAKSLTDGKSAFLKDENSNFKVYTYKI